MVTQVCIRCQTVKPTTEFFKSGYADQRRHTCKRCAAQYAAQRKEAIRTGRWFPTREKFYTKRAIMSPMIRDLEWAGGFLEGEGSFVRQNHVERIIAVQVNDEPIKRLLAFFGGSSRIRKLYPPNKHIFAWVVSGARARGVMMTLYSLMSGQRRIQIRTALVRRGAA